MTRDEFQHSCLTLLDEALDTPAGELDEGDGPPALVATADTLDEWTDQGIAYYATSAFAYAVRAVVDDYDPAAYAVSLTGLSAVALQETPGEETDGSTIWTATDVIWNPRPADGRGGQRLQRVSKAALDNAGMGPGSGIAGVPTYWALVAGESGVPGTVVFDKRPQPAMPIEIHGYGIPPSIIDTGDLYWAPANLIPGLRAYVCARVCEKNNNDPSLGPRQEDFAAAAYGTAVWFYKRLDPLALFRNFKSDPQPMYGVPQGVK